MRPRILNRPHSISVEVEVPAAGAEGVLFSMGGNDGGFAFFVQNGLLTYGYNYVAEQFFRVHSSGPIPVGHHIVSFEFTPPAPPIWPTARAPRPRWCCLSTASRWVRATCR